MHAHARYFHVRSSDDDLDVVPLLHAGLVSGGNRTLVSFEGERISFADMAGRVAGLQDWLAGHGLRQGDHVAIMLENRVEHIALIYALVLCGMVWIPVNTRLKGAAVSYQLERARPKLVIAQRGFEEALAGYAALHRGSVAWLEDLQAVPRTAADLVRAPARHADVLALMYTSGTTGAPKGVVFSHRMMRVAGESVLLVSDVRDGDRMFVWEPLCHIGGAQVLIVPFLKPVELCAVSRFSAGRIWAQLVSSRATQLHYLGGILEIMMQMPQEQQPTRHEVRVAWGAGVSARSWVAIERRMRFKLRECYGMTECSSFATVNETGTPGSIGRPLPWISLELLDEAGRPVGPGEVGEIVLSSAVEGVFLSSYFENPDATTAALRDGKLYTGDTARHDAAGELFFVGRRTDSMRVRGENVSAWEIERVFATHPAIAACAAVGVPSDMGEQEVLLYVQLKPGAAVTLQQLADWAEGQLASFQIPRFYRQVDAFDTTPSQRIRKHLLPLETAAAWDRLAPTLR